MKMYILIKESVPAGKAIVSAAHASLGAYLKFKERPEIEEWLSGPFHKCICKVSDIEFEKAKQYSDYLSLTESTLDNQEIALAFCPRL